MISYEEILKKYWGFKEFRQLQNEIIESVGNQKDTIALLPTGGGKSICFQVPGLKESGLTIVISPLIALMNDQVSNLKKRGIKAIAVSSSMTKREIDIALDNVIYGDYKFLYISPERLQSPLFRERLRKMKLNLLAIDEAHCISQWGYDFRPAYLKIAEIRDIHPNVPIIALTASATKKVEQDIMDKLSLREPNVFKKSFTRENLSYVVLKEENKERKLLDILSKVKGTSIVYVRSRKQSKIISQYLRDNGISADFYHAGLNSAQRNEKQNAWMNNLIRVIVSTNAFGMGIDKSEVRTVIHFDLCENPENYYQESGRAGRDGKKSYAVQLFNDRDKDLAALKIQNKFPELAFIKECYAKLGKFYNLAYGSGNDVILPFDLGDFASRFDLPILPTFYALKLLEQNNYIVLNEVDHNPSRIKIIVSNTAIYSYQIKNEKYAALINVLLRSYPHLFDEYVPIQENTIAKRINSKTEEIKKQLLALRKLNLIDYTPKHKSGSIYFSQARVQQERIRIEKSTYSDRKKVVHSKWKKMQDYIDNFEICRSKLLVSFFDEKDARNCGICDVCLERKKSNLSSGEFEHLLHEIKNHLAEKPLKIDELSEKMKHRKNDQVINAVRWLSDQRTLELKEDFLYWAQK